MNIHHVRFMVSVLGLAALPLAHASADDGAMPPLKIGSPQPRSDFYFKVDSGAEFFQPPDKNNSNFSQSINPAATEKTGLLGSQSGDDTTWRLGGTFGYYIPGHPAGWLGRNLRVEAFGDYFNTSNTERSALSVTPSGAPTRFLTVGRLDGNYSPTSQATDIGSFSFSPNPVAGEKLTTHDEFYEAGSAFRSDFILDQGQLVLSPKIGFQYSHLSQDFNTSAAGARGSVSQQEEIDTDYYGPKFALELKMQIAKNFVYFAEGEMDPFYASSNYSGKQFGTSVAFDGGAGNNSASRFARGLSFKAGATTGFYYDFGPIIVKVGGGFEYWDYAATVQEATVPVGRSTVEAVTPPVIPLTPFSVRASHLVGSNMLNPTANLSVIVPF